MMKLYTKPGACSTADHIALEWTGKPYHIEILTNENIKSPSFLEINPIGSVPALVDGDFTLTQNVAIMTYIADKNPQANLLGDGDPRQRAEAMRWLAMVNSDVHNSFIFIMFPERIVKDKSKQGEIRQFGMNRLKKFYNIIEKKLNGKEWITGFRSAADAYLYITLRWANTFEIDLSECPNLLRFYKKMEQDPSVKKVFKSEGII